MSEQASEKALHNLSQHRQLSKLAKHLDAARRVSIRLRYNQVHV